MTTQTETSDGARSTRIITGHEVENLASAWRTRADGLDAYGRRLRRDGDTRAAEDAEQAAVEYRIAADELVLGAES